MNCINQKTTTGPSFYPIGDANKRLSLFNVNADVPAIDALRGVSDLLSSMDSAVHDAAMGERPLEDNHAWLTLHTLRSAKAVVDSLLRNAETGGAQ
jgi:hypothetical protein